MPRVYVGIGSNVERERHIRAAMAALREAFGPVRASSVYRTPADGFEGDDFYNLVACFDTGATLEELRARLGAIETAHGRERNGERYAPRTLDIDILLYGSLVRHDRDFDIPRADIARPYVLAPLAELAPELEHPETGERMANLWRRLGDPAALHKVELDLRAD
jgi:2-amino-4-hydroxy-6-hydroxymethyldihydropteridine diphosphokinase